VIAMTLLLWVSLLLSLALLGYLGFALLLPERLS
jgi:K+-transporting ATPase KdpF subunit